MRSVLSGRRGTLPRVLFSFAILSGAFASTARAQVAATTTTLTTSGSPSTFNGSVTFRATIQGNGSGAPTGSVTFKVDGNTASTPSVSSIGAGATLKNKGQFTCAITTAGGVSCWGLNDHGEIGDGTNTDRHTPTPVSGLSSVIALATGLDHACALTSAGGVKCWGNNSNGQLGNNNNTDSFTPVDVTGLTSGVVAIGAGFHHSCAITSTGGLKCWGANTLAMLGDGSQTDRWTPVDVVGLSSGVAAVDGGIFFTCALMEAGGVKCWGVSNNGTIGTGDGNGALTPVDVLGLTSGVAAIAAGEDHACAVTTAGGLKCWGSNDKGQLGDGTTNNQLSPNDVSDLRSGVASVAAGAHHTCAITTGGAALCWGDNNSGDLGIGSTTEQNALQSVTGLSSGVSVIAAGLFITCAETSAGAVQCWGNDSSHGSLGDGFTTNQPSATAVSGLGAGSTLVAAKASFSTASLAVGSHSVAATYNGDISFGSSTSNTVSQQVNQASSSISLISAASPTDYDQPAIFIATVSSSAGTPTGTVTFKDGSTAIGSDTMAGGFAAVSLSTLAPGTHTITAVYGGDTNFTGVTSSGVTQIVNKATPGISLDPSPNPSGFQQSVTFTLTVSDSNATGTVIIRDTADTIFTGTLSGGKATFTTSSLSVGDHNMSANYFGDTNFNGAFSGQLTQTVNPGATTTTIVSGTNPTVSGQSVTFTATVAGAGATGTVTFKNGGSTLGSANLSSGAASFSTSALTVGGHSITAVYSGDGNFAGSTSSAITQNVNLGATTTGVTANPGPGHPGQAITLTATVTDVAPETATPTGAVTFTDGVNTLGTAALSQSKATITTTTLQLGSHSIHAQYAGSSTLAASSGTTTEIISAQVGAQFPVNAAAATALHEQLLPKVAALTSNGFVAVWASTGKNNAGYTIEGQRYTAGGTRTGGEFQVNTNTTGIKSAPAIAGLSSGGFVVVWQALGEDKSGYGIYAQRYAKTGAKVGVEFRVNSRTTSNQQQPSVASLPFGGFVVTWASQGEDGFGLGIYAQQYSEAGVPVGAEFRVNTTVKKDQSTPAVAGLATGGFVITWQSSLQDGSGFGVYMQTYAATGAKVGKETRVNTTTAGDQSLPSVAGLNDGTFVVTWQSQGQDGSGLGVYAQRFTAVGQAAGGEFLVNTTTAQDQWQPSVSAFGDGGFVVTWSSLGQDGFGQGVFAQAFSNTGAAVDAEFLVNTTIVNDQWQPSVAAFSKGTFVIVWTSQDATGKLTNIFGQRFEMDDVAAAARASHPVKHVPLRAAMTATH